jgi:mannobiose 2-epimerase
VKSRIKEAYGNSFAIYGLAAYYHASGDTGALNLAKATFQWLEKHSHDPKNKGYFQHLNMDGSVVKRSVDIPSTDNTGYKDQNSSIHLLEAFTELYQVWKDPLLKTRLNEMLVLIRDVITTPKGYLQLFLTPEWKAVTYNEATREVILKHRGIDHVSFGHDVETAYLIMEASEVLGIHNDKKTLAIGKKMVDHALRNGSDNQVGGFYDEGYYFKNKPSIEIILDSKNWWAQAEGLNTLLIMARLYPSDKMNYMDLFMKQWSYINKYLLDHEYGDWYESGLDKVPEAKTRLKAHIWKGSYHSFRALSNCIKMLGDQN